MIAHHCSEGRSIGKRWKWAAQQGHFPHVTDLKGIARNRRTGNDDGHHGRAIRMFEVVIANKPEEGQDQQRQLDSIYEPNPTTKPYQEPAPVLFENFPPGGGPTDAIGY